MPSAICPHCGEPAFSSAEFNRVWTCPSCGKRVMPTAPATGSNRSSGNREPIVEYYSRFWTREE